MTTKTQEFGDTLSGCCVSCACFRPSKKPLMGYCVDNSQAFKAMTGKKFSRGAPEGPSFPVHKLDGCEFWTAAGS